MRNSIRTHLIVSTLDSALLRFTQEDGTETGINAVDYAYRMYPENTMFAFEQRLAHILKKLNSEKQKQFIKCLDMQIFIHLDDYYPYYENSPIEDLDIRQRMQYLLQLANRMTPLSRYKSDEGEHIDHQYMSKCALRDIVERLDQIGVYSILNDGEYSLSVYSHEHESETQTAQDYAISHPRALLAVLGDLNPYERTRINMSNELRIDIFAYILPSQDLTIQETARHIRALYGDSVIPDGLAFDYVRDANNAGLLRAVTRSCFKEIRENSITPWTPEGARFSWRKFFLGLIGK